MDVKEILKEGNLRFSSDKKPGISRKRTGDSFSYYSPSGEKITDEETLDRINKLHIPPAWEKVWICTSPKGHLQAIGYDAKKRKQYRYHEEWNAAAQETKFDKLLTFADVLPRIRRHINKDMSLPGMPREKVIATIVWLLENTLIRIGNEEYKIENNSRGLTTLGNKNVDVKGNIFKFEFKGKSGVYHKVRVQSKKVAKIIRRCQDLPGQDLFEYIDDDKNIQSVNSEDVNNYLKEITQMEITAKEFRTWGGTTAAAEAFDLIGPSKDEAEMKRIVVDVVKKVAANLRNKPATCKKYYIHPLVFKAYTKGFTLSNLKKDLKIEEMVAKELQEQEKKVVFLLLSFS